MGSNSVGGGPWRSHRGHEAKEQAKQIWPTPLIVSDSPWASWPPWLLPGSPIMVCIWSPIPRYPIMLCTQAPKHATLFSCLEIHISMRLALSFVYASPDWLWPVKVVLYSGPNVQAMCFYSSSRNRMFFLGPHQPGNVCTLLLESNGEHGTSISSACKFDGVKAWYLKPSLNAGMPFFTHGLKHLGKYMGWSFRVLRPLDTWAVVRLITSLMV